jgi:hypothetical protein
MPSEKAVEAKTEGLGLFGRSSLLLFGTARAIEFCRAPESIPYTFVTFEDLRVLYGSHRERAITLAFAGGSANGKTSWVVQVPRFKRGQRYLLALTNRTRYRFTPTAGWTDGVWRVGEDGLSTYWGAPVVDFDVRRKELVAGAGGSGAPPPLDAAYGQFRLAEGKGTVARKGPDQEAGPAPRAKAMTEEGLAELLKAALPAWDLPAPAEGRTLAPGTPFVLGAIPAVAAVAEAKPASGPKTGSSIGNTEAEPEPHPPAGPLTREERYGFWFLDCGGSPMRWNANAMTLKRLPISFPTGSPAAAAVAMVEQRWNEVPGSSFRFTDTADNDNRIDLDGDGNEIAFVHPDDLDGAVGLTEIEASDCDPSRPGANMRILESDTMLANRPVPGSVWSVGAPDPRAFPDISERAFVRAVVLHELGHALGLSPSAETHEDGSIATMNSRYPVGGWYPGPAPERVLPHGDDRAGVRFIYPAGTAAELDLAVLNFAKATTSASNRANLVRSLDARLCPGHTIDVEYNFGNLGTASVNFNLGFYLSTNTTFSAGDILVASESWSSGVGLGSYGPGTLSRRLTIPTGVVYDRDYFVLVFADHDGAHAEAREGNNAVALPGHIHIPPQAHCDTAELIVNKQVVGSGTGLFNLRVDGLTRAEGVGNGGTTGPLQMAVGTHEVSETGSGGTDLDDYVSVFRGACRGGGTVVLEQGDSKTCTIVNQLMVDLRELCARLRDACLALDRAPGESLPARTCIRIYNNCMDR